MPKGAVVSKRDVSVDRAAVEAILERFRGPIDQVPPMHSALKRDGRPLYEYARRGITVERAARAVTIHRLELTGLDGDALSLTVQCSKGTYIRTLGEAIGDALGCGGHLIALRRTGVGTLKLPQAIPLAEFERLEAHARDACVLPIDTLIASLPSITLVDELARRFVEGQRLAWSDSSLQGRVRVYRAADPGAGHSDPLLLGTGLVGYDDRLAPVRLVANRPP